MTARWATSAWTRRRSSAERMPAGSTPKLPSGVSWTPMAETKVGRNQRGDRAGSDLKGTVESSLLDSPTRTTAHRGPSRTPQERPGTPVRASHRSPCRAWAGWRAGRARWQAGEKARESHGFNVRRPGSRTFHRSECVPCHSVRGGNRRRITIRSCAVRGIGRSHRSAQCAGDGR